MTTPVVVPNERVSREDALRELHDLGAHFVLCDLNKKPLEKKWPTKHPSIEAALLQGPKELGIILASLDIVGIDVDVTQQPGDKANSRVHRSVAQNLAVVEILGPPLGTVTTPSGGGHMLYKGNGREGNMRWAYGDICGANLHAVIYDAAALLRAAKLAQSDDVEPVDVLRLKSISPNNIPKKEQQPTHTPEGLRLLTQGEGRNTYLNTGVFGDARDGELTPERTDAWRAAAHASGLSPSEIDATMRSAMEAGQKAEIEFIRHPISNRIVVKNQRNLKRAFRRVKADLWFDEFNGKRMISFGPFHDCAYEDEHRARLLSDIESICQFIPPDGYFDRVVSDVQWRHKVHPVRDFLEALVWDQQSRIDDWLRVYAGVIKGENANEEAYIKAVSRIFLMAAVGRIYQPGVKFDEMVVLESPQGTGKSSLLRSLCPRDSWFSDDLPLNVDAKQIIERTAGKWLIEAAELSGMHSSKVEHLKTMLSRGSDGPVRMAYGRLPVERPRHFVLMGTTNAAAYLDDPTGNRRFWPVVVNKILLPELRRDRDQLWAEAVVRWKDPEHGGPASIRLHETLYEVAGTEQEKRRTVDPWESVLEAEFPGDCYRLMPRDVWQALGIPSDRQDQRMAKRVSAIMQGLGFRRMSVRDPQDRDRVVRNGFGKGSPLFEEME